MKHVRTYAATAVATLALGLGAGTAYADKPAKPSDEPCAQQQAQVDKAKAQLEKVTAVFEGQPNAENKKDKKAQKQRLARAEERLATCRAEHAA